MAGSIADRYVLVDVLGRGGMGIVYRAYDSKLRREVALKLVRVADGPSGPQRRERILREAHALARLSDPHVVAVYDVGDAGDDVYIAMELVLGETLRQWLERAPAPPAILRTFLEAGRGLAAAHAVGILHGDFKPDNVMIGADGRTRVLDFGLARGQGLLRGDGAASGEASGPTPESTSPWSPAPGVSATAQSPAASSSSAGTPRYMAPEQWMGGVADARSDAYSFCVALYDAFYGVHPLFGEDASMQLATKPLRRLPGIARPHLVHRALVRGLSVSPDARYPTMVELLRALQAPPVAKGGPWVVLAVVGALALGALGIAWSGARRDPCANAAASLAGAWDAPRREALERTLARATFRGGAATRTRLLAGLDAYGARWAAMHADACRATRVFGTQSEALMDLRMQCLLRRRDTLRGFVDALEEPGVPVRALEDAAEGTSALAPLEPCRDVDTLLRTRPLPDVPTTRARVEALRRRTDQLRGRAISADVKAIKPAILAIVAEARELGFDAALADAITLEAWTYSALGETEAAIDAYGRALRAAGLGHDDYEVARASVALAEVYKEKGDHGTVLALAPAVHASLDRIEAPAGLRGRFLNALGWSLRELSRFDEAAARHEEVLRLNPNDPQGRDAMGRAHDALGLVYRHQGRIADAERETRTALELLVRESGPDHPSVANAMNNLGVLLQSAGRRAEARELFERSQRINDGYYFKDDPARVLPLANLAALAADEGRYAEARPLLLEIHTSWERALGPNHPDVASVEQDLGRIAFAEGQHEEARKRYESAVRRFEASAVAGTSRTAIAYAGVARCQLALRHPLEALAASERALALSSMSEPLEHGTIELQRADVLWETKTDRGGARKLALAARARAAGQGPGAESTLREIDAWLDSHAAP